MASPLRWVFGAVVLASLTLVGGAGGAAVVSAGYQAQSYAPWSSDAAGGAVSGQKPESKLWYAQGSWWAAMTSTTTGAHDVFQLAGGSWVDTGVVIDAESTTKEDVLWDGTQLYVLSRTPTASEPSRLRRFHYVDGSYHLDPGFPVDVPGGGSESETIAKDSTGTLWLAYASDKKNVTVSHTVGSDTTWSAPIVLPFAQAQGLAGDDIAAVLAFTDASGPAIGVAWDNERLDADFFAVHRDGAADSAWTIETTLSGPLQADDHMNLKAVEGKVYEVVKTATTTPGTPLIKLLVRSPTGTWSQYPVALYDEHNTRPVVILDLSARQIDVFLSKGDAPAHGILLKQSPLDQIAFPATAAPFIVGSANQTINNATSTKQNVDATSGIAVLASDGASYWWNGLGAATSPPPSTTPPPAATAVAASTAFATPVTLTLSASGSCSVAFAVASPPANGTLGTIVPQPCSANSVSATVVYTPNASFSGTDSFTYRVTTAGGLTAGAPVTIDVAPPPPPPATTFGTLVPSALSVGAGTAAGGDASALAVSDDVDYSVASTTGSSPKTAYTATATVPSGAVSLAVTIESSATTSCKQTVEIRNVIDGSWVALDSRTIGPADATTPALSVPWPFAPYLDASGRIRLQVRCGGAASAFTHGTDLLLVTYGLP